MADCNLTLPCTSTCSGPSCSVDAGFTILNEASNAIHGIGRTGITGSVPVTFPIGTGVQGSSISGNGVLGTSSTGIGVAGTGGQAGIQGLSETGRAGWFEVDTPTGNPPSPGIAVFAKTDGSNSAIESVVTPTGTGSAGFFHVDNTRSNVPALLAKTLGAGGAISAVAPRVIAKFGRRTPGIIGDGSPAASFHNDVEITGILQSTGKQFVIDHPLDPANRRLVHASVESSEMANVYSGNATLDDKGEAWIELPEWLEALNSDFRYQLTCLGRFAPVYVAEELSKNRFKIAGGEAGMRVSWQLTGIRQDPWAQAHPLIVEETKSAEEQGLYRHPEVYGQPENKAMRQIYLET